MAWIEIPKKNGKSTLSSGLGLYLLVGDQEPSAEVYNGAVDKEQASIVFNEADSMIAASKALNNSLATLISRD